MMRSELSSAALACGVLVATAWVAAPDRAGVVNRMIYAAPHPVAAVQQVVGWSARKALLGRTVHEISGAELGTVEDLIVAPGKNENYLIVAVGGVFGIGSQEAVISLSRIEDRGGRLVMTGRGLAAVRP